MTLFVCLLDLRSFHPVRIINAWWLGAQLGMGLWIAAWYVFGGGTGLPDPITGAIALGTWLAWLGALRVHGVSMRRTDGILLAVVLLTVLLLYRVLVPLGSSLIMLELNLGVVGLCVYLVVEALHRHMLARIENDGIAYMPV